MTDDRPTNSAPPPTPWPLIATGKPFADRVGDLVRAWEADGRDPDRLVDGKPFFALYCWHLWTIREGRPHDAATAAYVASAHRANGGAAGWDALLRGRAYCSCHGERWRLENLSICLGCLEYVCFELGRPCCHGAPVVG
ncbi:hypothetical protein ABT263_12005 [Kitasatospora sp. NPDC001603]|uniref:hypothetical protein n=1 Tax=Kitasatospora sp. NPDC001603 TaxID=3154388 RepID=UPI0033312C15